MTIELDKIYNMDCLDGMKAIPDGSVDLVVTSPPYNYNVQIYYGKYKCRSGKDFNKYAHMMDDNLPMEDYYQWQKECIAEMLRVTKGLVFYNIQMITGNKVALFRILGDFAENIKEIIIWDKNFAEPAVKDRVLNSQYEFIIVFDKEKSIYRQFDIFNAPRGTVSNIWKINKNRDCGIKDHHAMFPVKLPRSIISIFSQEGQTVLDPFMGSGTTAVACIKEKRHFIGFELNKEYYDKACQRIDAVQRQLTIF